MSTISAITTLLPFTTGELATNIDDSIHLLTASYEYSQDHTVAKFYANVSTPFAGDKLIINLVKDGTLLTSLETVTSTTRFSFEVDISDLTAADDYATEVYYTTSNLTGGDTFDLSASGLIGEEVFGDSALSDTSVCTASGVVARNGIASLSGVSTLTGIAEVDHKAISALTSVVSITAAGGTQIDVFGYALESVVACTATAKTDHKATVTLSNSITLTATGKNNTAASAYVTNIVSLSATAMTESTFILAEALLTSQSLFTAFASLNLYAAAVLNTESTLVVEEDEEIIIEPTAAEELAVCIEEGPIYCNGALIPARTYCGLKSRMNVSRTCTVSRGDPANSLSGLKI